MMRLAWTPSVRHTICARKTARAGFSSLNDPRRTSRCKAVFLRPYAFARLLWAGLGGGIFGCAGSLGRRSANPALCPPTPFSSGARVKPVQGGHDMAALPHPAHSAHTFPLTEKAARRAARLWFTGAPATSLAQWRDERCQAHCGGLPADTVRAAAFNAAFAGELANIIAGGCHV